MQHHWWVSSLAAALKTSHRQFLNLSQKCNPINLTLTNIKSEHVNDGKLDWPQKPDLDSSVKKHIE